MPSGLDAAVLLWSSSPLLVSLAGISFIFLPLWEVQQSFKPWTCHLGWETFVGGRYNLMLLHGQAAVLLFPPLFQGYYPFPGVIEVEIHQWCVLFFNYVTKNQKRIWSGIIFCCLSVHRAPCWPLTVPRERLKAVATAKSEQWPLLHLLRLPSGRRLGLFRRSSWKMSARCKLLAILICGGIFQSQTLNHSGFDQCGLCFLFTDVYVHEYQ